MKYLEHLIYVYVPRHEVHIKTLRPFPQNLQITSLPLFSKTTATLKKIFGVWSASFDLAIEPFCPTSWPELLPGVIGSVWVLFPESGKCPAQRGGQRMVPLGPNGVSHTAPDSALHPGADTGTL